MIIESLHRKPRADGERGVPKPSVDRLDIRQDGVAGDYNRYRQETLKGDLDMAILLHCAEVLETLASEGWPVGAGDLGENLLLRGVEYSGLEPGARLRAGGVEMTVTKAATPCSNLSVLPYVGDARIKAFMQALSNRRGWYARVTREGAVAVGDAVTVEGVG